MRVGRLAFVPFLSVSLLVGCSDADSGSAPTTPAAADAGTRGDAIGETGADASTLKCTGVSLSCSSLGDGECTLAKGCRSEDKCTGVSSSCGGLGEFSCADQKGCYWSSSSGYCSGSAWSCDLLDSSSCISQDGCTTNRVCNGVSASCDTLSASQCLLQPGCRLE